MGVHKPRQRRQGTPLTFPPGPAESRLPRAKPNNLPFVSIAELFMGRDTALQELRRRFESDPSKATAVVTPPTRQAIHGLGGIGKTRLAVEFAWRHEADYAALLFVTADSPERLQANLAALAELLGLPERQATEQPVQVAAVLAWLAEHPGWLLIVDNVDQPAAARAVEKLLPKWRAGQVLITSRLSNWSPAVQPLELDVLDAASAAEFLLARTNSPRAAESAAVRLANELGGLALALEQAAAYARRMRLTLAAYHEEWQKHNAAVPGWYDARLMQYPASLAITWQTTLDQLTPDAVGLLEVLAWFAPEPIPISLFSVSSVPLCFKKDEGKHRGTEVTEASVREPFAELADFSMLTWEAESVKVHRVVQEILRTRQPEPDRCLTTALRLLNTARPKGRREE